MKKLIILPILAFACSGLTGCNDVKTIRVGASPSPHSEILKSDVVKNYIENAGYKLKVVEYQDYITPNKALNDGGIDANYFQHIPYLEEEVATKGYAISAVAKVHYEPLNLYGKTKITDFTGKTVNVINDVSNLDRALELLKDKGLIDTYNLDNFDTSHPEASYTSSIGVTVKCVDNGLLTNKVEDDGYAVIPGNFALTKWGSAKAIEYCVFGESKEVAGKKANIIATRTSDVASEKTKVLCEALSQDGVGDFITAKYGPTVVYSYEYLL
ncbi:MAG: MetQ/NlpA family ABC transporter substrate-binding protein [Bacilli bacterium]|nr:MetQ/NlpA family ABC transporter substrate-binding protein [Bacilli bacterium]